MVNTSINQFKCIEILYVVLFSIDRPYVEVCCVSPLVVHTFYSIPCYTFQIGESSTATVPLSEDTASYVAMGWTSDGILTLTLLDTDGNVQRTEQTTGVLRSK